MGPQVTTFCNRPYTDYEAKQTDCILRMRKYPVFSPAETQESSVGRQQVVWLRRRWMGRKSVSGRGNEKAQRQHRRRPWGRGAGHREERGAQRRAKLLRLQEDSKRAEASTYFRLAFHDQNV